MVRLPLREQPVEAARGTLLTDAAWQHSRRVLLVDDNQDGVELLAEALALQGHQVHVAFEAEQGLLLAEQHRPQLALSGYSQQGDRERARAAGFAHYLVKPVDPARLLALMAAFGADAGPAQRQSPDDSAMAPLS